VFISTLLCPLACVGRQHCEQLNRRLSRHSSQCPLLTSVGVLLSAYQSSSTIPAPLPDYTADVSTCTCDDVTAADRAAITALLPLVAFYHHHRMMKERSHALYMHQTETSVQPDTVVITIDFKENIKVNCGPVEASRVFYDQSLRTVVGFCLVYLDPRTQRVHRQYIDIISSCLTHNATFALECLDLIIRDYVLPLGMRTVHLWCDSGRHFRCDEFAAGALVRLRLVHDDHHLDTHLHYFTEKHGKSPVDGHFSLLSRWLQQATTQRQIISTHDLITALRQQAQSHLQAERRPEQSTHAITFIPFTPICQQHQAGWHDAVLSRSSSSLDGDVPVSAPGSGGVCECSSSVSEFAVSESTPDPYEFPSSDAAPSPSSASSSSSAFHSPVVAAAAGAATAAAAAADRCAAASRAAAAAAFRSQYDDEVTMMDVDEETVSDSSSDSVPMEVDDGVQLCDRVEKRVKCIRPPMAVPSLKLPPNINLHTHSHYHVESLPSPPSTTRPQLYTGRKHKSKTSKKRKRSTPIQTPQPESHITLSACVMPNTVYPHQVVEATYTTKQVTNKSVSYASRLQLVPAVPLRAKPKCLKRVQKCLKHIQIDYPDLRRLQERSIRDKTVIDLTVQYQYAHTA
jgi:hypothetical protein